MELRCFLKVWIAVLAFAVSTEHCLAIKAHGAGKPHLTLTRSHRGGSFRPSEQASIETLNDDAISDNTEGSNGQNPRRARRCRERLKTRLTSIGHSLVYGFRQVLPKKLHHLLIGNALLEFLVVAIKRSLAGTPFWVQQKLGLAILSVTELSHSVHYYRGLMSVGVWCVEFNKMLSAVVPRGSNALYATISSVASLVSWQVMEHLLPGFRNRFYGSYIGRIIVAPLLEELEYRHILGPFMPKQNETAITSSGETLSKQKHNNNNAKSFMIWNVAVGILFSLLHLNNLTGTIVYNLKIPAPPYWEWMRQNVQYPVHDLDMATAIAETVRGQLIPFWYSFCIFGRLFRTHGYFACVGAHSACNACVYLYGAARHFLGLAIVLALKALRGR